MDDMNAALAKRLSEQFSQQAANDPLTAMLLAQLSNPAESVDEDRELRTLHRRLERATSAVGRLQQELSAANAMAIHVANVLGACPDCWGLDRFCRQCLGAGVPGSQDPDITALVEWIKPALDKAGLSIGKIRSGSQLIDQP